MKKIILIDFYIVPAGTIFRKYKTWWCRSDNTNFVRSVPEPTKVIKSRYFQDLTKVAMFKEHLEPSYYSKISEEFEIE